MAPWVDVAMDFLGPLPNSDYLFVMVDYYNRYKEIKIMRTIDAKKYNRRNERNLFKIRISKNYNRRQRPNLQATR